MDVRPDTVPLLIVKLIIQTVDMTARDILTSIGLDQSPGVEVAGRQSLIVVPNRFAGAI